MEVTFKNHAKNVSVCGDRYLEDDHLKNCPPETLAAGLQKLPLPYVYVWQDNNNLGWDTNSPANQKLPTGEVLKGSKTYESFMRFYTTFDITPAQLRDKALNRLNSLYSKVRLFSLLFITIFLFQFAILNLHLRDFIYKMFNILFYSVPN